MLHELWNSDIVLSELVIGSAGEIRIPDAATSRLVNGTGGEAVMAGNPGEAFRQSLRGIRSRYTLYYPAPDGVTGSERNIQLHFTPDAARRFPLARIHARTATLLLQTGEMARPRRPVGSRGQAARSR